MPRHPRGLVLASRYRCPLAIATALAAISSSALPAFAEITVIAPWSSASQSPLQTVLRSASPGDTILLKAGVHLGPLRIDRRIVLRGEPGAILDGGGRGRVLEVAAMGTVVEDLEVRGSGRRVLTVDGGIYLIRAAGVILRRLRIEDALYGIYAERSDDVTIESCDLTGTVRPRADSGEGNGIHLWYCQRSVVRDCSVELFADAIYLAFAHDAIIERSRFSRNARYGFHTMYCQDNHLSGNTFSYNLAGCAIMFSNRLRVLRNDFVHNRGSRTYGLLLRDCSDGEFAENRLVDNTIAVFMDDSNRNRIVGNLIADNGWGVLLFSSSDGNVFARNSFLNNDYPVALDMKFTDNRFDDGKSGNYWSENAAYDLDGNGMSDVPYSPVSAFAFLSKQYPDLSVLARSPAVAALSVAERVVPALRPSEAVDRFPLVTPPSGSSAEASMRPSPPRPAWPWAMIFLALGSTGLMGLLSGRQPR